jgi:hypothetical protein
MNGMLFASDALALSILSIMIASPHRVRPFSKVEKRAGMFLDAFRFLKPFRMILGIGLLPVRYPRRVYRGGIVRAP